MRQETHTVNVYTFDELSDTAKDRAIQDYDALGYSWADEALDSLKAFARELGGSLSNWEIDWSEPARCSWRFDAPDFEPGELAELVNSWPAPEGNCPWTGYCMDDDCIEGAKEAIAAGEDDPTEVFRAGFEAWIRSANSDYEALLTHEAYSEHCEANGYEFTEDGKLY